MNSKDFCQESTHDPFGIPLNTKIKMNKNIRFIAAVWVMSIAVTTAALAACAGFAFSKEPSEAEEKKLFAEVFGKVVFETDGFVLQKDFEKEYVGINRSVLEKRLKDIVGKFEGSVEMVVVGENQVALILKIYFPLEKKIGATLFTRMLFTMNSSATVTKVQYVGGTVNYVQEPMSQPKHADGQPAN